MNEQETQIAELSAELERVQAVADYAKTRIDKALEILDDLALWPDALSRHGYDSAAGSARGALQAIRLALTSDPEES